MSGPAWPGQEVRPTAAPQGGGPRPILTVPDPEGDAEEARRVQDQQVQMLAEAREAERLRLAQSAEVRAGVAAKEGTEAQGKAGTMLTRIRGSFSDIMEVVGGNPTAQAPGLVEAATSGLPPLIARRFRDEDRRIVEDAQVDALDALLTLGTGAAYTPEQLRGQLTSYFPQYGDSPKEIEFKNRRMSRVIEAARVQAGPLAGQLDEAIAPYIRQFQAQEDKEQAGTGGGDENPWPGVVGEDGRPLPPEGGYGRDPETGEWGLYTRVTDDSPERPSSGPGSPIDGNSPGYQQVAAGVGDAVEAVGSVAGLIANPLNATVNALTGSNLTTDFGQYLRNLTGLPEGDPRIGAINQAAMSAFLPGFLASKGVDLASPGAVQEALKVVGASPLRDLVAGFAAGTAGEVVKDAGGGPVAQAGAMLLGGGVGAVAGSKLVPSVTNAAVPQVASEGSQVLQSAQRLNRQFGTKIEPLPADVGGAGIQKLTGAAAELPLSASAIVRGGERVSTESQKARNAIAALAGDATQPETAGEAAAKGAQAYMKRSATKVDALYAKARRLGGDTPVDLAKARTALDGHIAELSETPGGAAALTDLKALRAELDGTFPVEGVKRMRTQLRDRFMDQGLRRTDIERRVNQVVDAAEEDIAAGLTAAGKTEAAAAYSAAASAHRERVGLIDEVIAPIIGKKGEKSGEEILAAIDRATRSNGARLGKFIAALPAEDAGTVRATIISRLGQVSKGRQDAEGTAFSLNDFLTHWNGMTDRAKSAMFGGELRAALTDLARVAGGTKEAQRFANKSHTGGPVALVASGSVASEVYEHPIKTALFFIPQAVAGRILASPKLARALAKVPANDPAAAERQIKVLSRVAATDASLATDVRSLQQALTKAFDPAPLAASMAPQKEGGETSKTTEAVR